MKSIEPKLQVLAACYPSKVDSEETAKQTLEGTEPIQFMESLVVPESLLTYPRDATIQI